MSKPEPPAPRGVGRPEGTTESPRMLLEREIQLNIKLIRDVRDIAKSQIAEVSKMLKDVRLTLNVETRLAIATQLVELITALGKSVDAGVKSLATTESVPESVTEEEVLKSFI